MNKNSLIVAGAVLIILIIGGYAYIQSQQSKDQTSAPAVSQTPQSPVEVSPLATQSSVITITPSGFSPAQVTVQKGAEVVWVNTDTDDHQVNSDVHPTHQLYPPLNTIGLLKPGEKKSLTFPTPGIYKFHDHLNPSLTGIVVVQ